MACHPPGAYMFLALPGQVDLRSSDIIVGVILDPGIAPAEPFAQPSQGRIAAQGGICRIAGDRKPGPCIELIELLPGGLGVLGSIDLAQRRGDRLDASFTG